MSSVPTAPWRGLIERWDAQQAVYVRHREQMYDVLLDVLIQQCPDRDLTVLDLACGPGAISRRLLERVPSARSVAVDVDPVLLAIGEGAYGDLDGRLRWVRADLRDPRWVDELGEDGAAGTFDAVVSSTALHWLDPATVVATYRHCWELLAPGGVLLNADYLPHARGSRIATACETVTLERQRRAVAAGADSWDVWWEAVADEPALAQTLSERALLWPEGTRDWTGATGRFHETALLDAGFDEAGTIWRDLREAVVLAVR